MYSIKTCNPITELACRAAQAASAILKHIYRPCYKHWHSPKPVDTFTQRSLTLALESKGTDLVEMFMASHSIFKNLRRTFRIPNDCIELKRYPLFMPREVMRQLSTTLLRSWRKRADKPALSIQSRLCHRTSHPLFQSKKVKTSRYRINPITDSMNTGKPWASRSFMK